MSEGANVTMDEMTGYNTHHKANILYVSSRKAINKSHHVL